ncbi:hypothetical protein DRP04_10310 [Archaeoglobales archaeon]|nr:MAG: hypothetical protein DRP04_10310 [Archaeoglobales archaeon]
MYKSVKDTVLYKIVERHNKKLAGNIEEAYEIANKILKRIEYYFPEETDHDISHSLRIIKNAEILLNLKNVPEGRIEDTVGLSVYDIYFLILGALFHDIGMVPDSETMKGIIKKVLGVEKNWRELSDKERERVKKHIKKRHGELSALMLKKDSLEYEEGKPESVELTDDLRAIGLDKYYRSLLATICEGHKIEIRDLPIFVKDRGFERPIYESERLHLIPIIALLQLSDDLDITEKRTPELIYKLYIKKEYPEVKIKWLAHMCVQSIGRDGGIINIVGECDDPEAYAQFADYISGVREKLDEIRLIPLDEAEKVKTVLPCTISTEIRKRGFKVSDLKLRIARQEMLRLLSKQLYGGKWEAAIRELLQNAIDSCKYKAMKRFEKEEPYEPEVRVNFDGKVLVVEDNGKGMTMDEIKSFLLNIGKCYYEEGIDLGEKKKINPISTFGIGLLSCFMLTDKIVIETKPMNEEESYRIEIHEDLSRSVIVWEGKREKDGTEVIIEVKDEIAEELKKKLKEIVDYWLVDTTYKIGDREVRIRICCNSDCWTPSIEDRFEKIKGEGRILILFENKNEDYDAKFIVCERAHPSKITAYKGILVEEDIPVSLPLEMELGGVLNIKNDEFAKISLARNRIEGLSKEFVNSLEQQITESIVSKFDEIPEEWIDWSKFDAEKHRELFEKVCFECVVRGERKKVKNCELVKLSESIPVVILDSEYLTTLFVWEKLVDFLVVESKRPNSLSNALKNKLGVEAKIVDVKYLIKEGLVEPCLDCVKSEEERKPFLRPLYLFTEQLSIIDELGGTCPVVYYPSLVGIPYGIYKFRGFSDKLFEVCNGVIVFNRNHPFIEKMCEVVRTGQVPVEVVRKYFEDIKYSNTLERINDWAVACFQVLLHFKKPGIYRKGARETLLNILSTLNPLAGLLGVELTERDLPSEAQSKENKTE